MSRTQILAIGVDKVTMQEAVACCLGYLAEPRSHLVVTPNAEIAYAAAHDPGLAAIINKADLVVPDGSGVVLASHILGDPVPEKVAGADLVLNLLTELAKRNGRIYLLGTRPEVVAEAARRVAQRFPGVTVTGFRDGFFKPEEEPGIVAAIAQANADLLLVGMGAPRQERWLARYLPDLNTRVCIGTGGTIDVLAGVAQRAPQWLISLHLEWLFRIVKFGRYGRSLPPLIKFVLKVAARRLRGG